jgi:starch synthase
MEDNRMKIVMATSEVDGYAKTGGLADVVPALAKSLAQLGHEVKIVMPRYYIIDKDKLTLLPGALGVPMGGGEEWCAVYTENLPGTEKNPMEVYFIDHENFFGRKGLYGDDNESDYHDNSKRFSFFSRAVFQLCRKIGCYPDILHAHDWETALVPVYLKFAERNVPNRIGGFDNTASILTIHNMGYQGIYNKVNYDYMGLGWDVFYHAGFEFWESLNMLRAGIYSADKLNTVSPTYAKQTKTESDGFKLDWALRDRAGDYLGILNGVDIELWNPSKDPFLSDKYSINNMAGKAQAKEALQERFGLPKKANIPVIGMVGRLDVDQKGLDVLFYPDSGCAAGSICKDMEIQFVILGSGDTTCENHVKNLTLELHNFKAYIGYSNEIAHLIEAGSDFFLMPSRYEPCGLNQMYSQVYGTIPIVRNTGGLADTVENYNQKTGGGTGFVFNDLTSDAVYNTVKWAVDTWKNNRDHIKKMRLEGMKKVNQYSWEESALKYVELYEAARKKAVPADTIK